MTIMGQKYKYFLETTYLKTVFLSFMAEKSIKKYPNASKLALGYG